MFWYDFGWFCVWTRENFYSFRPSESLSPKRKSQNLILGFYSRVSLRRPILVLSDTLTRSGENGSLKRGHDETCHIFRSNPRLGEGLWVWANEGHAQARRSRLSESSWRAIVSHSLRRGGLAWARQIHSLERRLPAKARIVKFHVPCIVWAYCFIFPKLRELYASVLWCWAWRTKSIESGMCLAWVAS